jgi:hypothetical protein
VAAVFITQNPFPSDSFSASISRSLCHQILEAGVLFLEPMETPDLLNTEPSILAAPATERVLRDTMNLPYY